MIVPEMRKEEHPGKPGAAFLIAGPTASGKSALALRLAAEHAGAIVNVDSMQVYSVLDRLTARPQADALAAVPHHLYGHVHPGAQYSVGAWLAEVEKLLRAPGMAGRTLVFVGGTGLYFRALLGGLSRMPEVPAKVRDYWRNFLAENGAAALHAQLARRDPAGAAALQPADSQRILRALAVFEISGRPIAEWRGTPGRPLIEPATVRRVLIAPDRSVLATRIERRFHSMVDEGAMEEVRALMAFGLDPDLPAMKAIGVRELHAADRGEMSLDEAIERAVTATRQYAKRQMSWFRNQAGPGWERIAAPEQWPLTDG